MSHERRPRKRTAKKRVTPERPALPVSPGEFFNREQSWLEFNRRVLSEARDARNRVLDRLKFLTIFTSNLDEFFMNRVGGLKQKISAGRMTLTPDGLSTEQQLELIRTKTMTLVREQSECYRKEIRPTLKQNGVSLLEWNELTPEERGEASKFFQERVFSVLTPQAVDPGHPFPFISNLSISLGVMVKHPEREELLFARVKIPPTLPQVLKLTESSNSTEQLRFVSLLTIVANNLEALFPGMGIHSTMPLRVTRSATIDVDDYEVDDLVEMMEEELRERRFARAIRLEHGSSPHPTMIQLLMSELELKEHEIFESDVAIDFPALREIAELSIPSLRAEPWPSFAPLPFMDEEANIFSLIRNGDVIVHHPYESFTSSVERFLRAAVDDPKVLAIKMTLYRVGDKNSLVPLLIRAAENEKHVVCLIEVKANFDEARNIRVAQLLEDAGVHVMYGVQGLKTHAKLTLVARQEHEGVRSYAHIGTGNYNSQTARFYTDVGLFTANREICDDLVDLFHALTGWSMKRDYKRLLVAPHNMADKFHALIVREIENFSQGKPARIIAKMNSLQDSLMCELLSKAAQAGVQVDLIVRGICCFKPEGRPNVRVISVVGRYLEHSRIFYFQNGAENPIDGEFYIGSADWMYRNLHRRVEVATPVLERTSRERCWEILETMLADRRNAWELNRDGTYTQRMPSSEIEASGSQAQLMRFTKERIAQFQRK